MVERLFRDPTILDTKSSRELFLQTIVELAFELEYRLIDETDALLHFTDEKAVGRVSMKLKEIWDDVDNLTDEKLLEISNGGSAYVVDSMALLIAMLLGGEPSFDSVIRVALLGGDADTNGTIVDDWLTNLLQQACLPVYMEELKE
jgi:ADP-ribosylglycohydrolase